MRTASVCVCVCVCVRVRRGARCQLPIKGKEEMQATDKCDPAIPPVDVQQTVPSWWIVLSVGIQFFVGLSNDKNTPLVDESSNSQLSTHKPPCRQREILQKTSSH